ncbi:unnamed protein product [Peronospora effusa]|nr:unnamed protein product [Peronospora effusa]
MSRRHLLQLLPRRRLLCVSSSPLPCFNTARFYRISSNESSLTHRRSSSSSHSLCKYRGKTAQHRRRP